MAAPFSWDPSQFWDGDDGSWSSFNLRVGSPAQLLRVLPSTAGTATWAVLDRGCAPSKSTAPNCQQARAGTLNTTSSSTWELKGNYALGLEANFGRGNISATYGLDTVALGFSNSTGGLELNNQIVAGFTSNVYYLGTFGLGQQPTHLSTPDDSNPSFLANLASKGIIPSRSWSYTAGARYRSKGVFGSLTLGGYDASRFIPNNVPFHLAGDISRDLVVGLQSITSRVSNGTLTSLLPTSILTFIDSSWPYIYLPPAACQLFEETLGLTYDPTHDLYTINDTLHQTLKTSNPTFTFTIADSQSGGANVDIVLPYMSFDLEAVFPLVSNSTRYFPIRRAANETQYTLGRAFLQEAYISTNYENSTFSVSQCKFEEGAVKNIVHIPSANVTAAVSPSANSPLSLKSIAGITSGAIVLLALILLILMCILRRRSIYRRKEHEQAALKTTDSQGTVEQQRVLYLQEIDENSLYGVREVPDNGIAEMQDEHLWMPELHEIAPAELRDEKSAKSVVCQVQELPSPEHSPVGEPTSIETDARPAPTQILTARPPPPRSRFALTLSAELTWRNRLKRREIGISHHSSQPAGTRSTPNLNRPLPPTPISESPQMSRVVSATEQELIEDILTFYHRSYRTPRRSGGAFSRSEEVLHRSGEASLYW